jgi:hypothetical protein
VVRRRIVLAVAVYAAVAAALGSRATLAGRLEPEKKARYRRVDVVMRSSIFFFAMCHAVSLHSVQFGPLNMAAAF